MTLKCLEFLSSIIITAVAITSKLVCLEFSGILFEKNKLNCKIRTIIMNINTNFLKMRPMSLRKVKRFRSAFTTEQINFLENQFKKFPYISSEHRKEVATALQMQERAVKIWFQNRRMKEKKETGNKESEEVNEDRKHNSSNECSSSTRETFSPLPTFSVPSEAVINVNKRTEDIPDLKPQYPKVNVYKEMYNNIPRPLEVPATKSVITNLKKPTNVTEDLYKTYKQERQENTDERRNMSVSKELESPTEFNNLPSTLKTAQDLSARHKVQKNQNFSIKSEDYSTNINVSNHNVPRPENRKPAFVSVMPTIYAHPFATPGGVIWKPMNMMPVGSMPVPTPQESLQNVSCNCNCHKRQMPVNFNQVNDPYSQYVVSVPF